ncbi:hypothetical protein VTH82DRAFT_6173 [Thermothelomyces myriococcoides]
MPSFTSRDYTPEHFRSFSKVEDDIMEDITRSTTAMKLSPTSPPPLAMVPSNGSLLDYFDLPSPPSTPRQQTNTIGYSSFNTPSSLSASPGQISRRHSSGGTPDSRPAKPSLPRWPTAFQRINRLPVRSRSRSASSSSSLPSSPTSDLFSSPRSSSSSSSFSPPTRPSTFGRQPEDVDNNTAGRANAMGAGGPFAPPPPPPVIRNARRTPYYPPNSSRNVDRTRVYMQRGPHFVPNWTPLSSLPRHVQLQIEERMTRFTAI